MKSQTHQKTLRTSKSFKAPPERGTTQAKGAIYFKNKKPKPIKELLGEFK